MNTMYKDQIWRTDDDGNRSELIWENEPYENRWRGDNHPDSEYNKMMDLDAEYNFGDWENAPYFEHALIEISPKGIEREIKCSDLVDEFMNT